MKTIYCSNGTLLDGDAMKLFVSSEYNYSFNKKNGYFEKWGSNRSEDPDTSPFPEILDIELSTSSTCSSNCNYCYKNNGNKEQQNKNMTLEVYKNLLDKFLIYGDASFVTQIAFGICDINTNPDFFPIMEYTKSKGIIPNYTTNGNQVTEEIAKKTKELCGAVAVSIHSKNSYDAIKKYVDAGIKQVNIHFMLAEETFIEAYKLLHDILNDSKLKGINALVFLQCKEKGKAKGIYHSIKDLDKFKLLIADCEKSGINYGMDSCSASNYLKITNGKNKDYVECCESTISSFYINVDGIGFPCSFAEGESNWDSGIDVLNCDDFVNDVWHNDKVEEFRSRNISSTDLCNCNLKNLCRKCTLFQVTCCGN
jgi:sulfatase maturation enzyme AslB (radical SAM superfamily)